MHFTGSLVRWSTGKQEELESALDLSIEASRTKREHNQTAAFKTDAPSVHNIGFDLHFQLEIYNLGIEFSRYHRKSVVQSKDCHQAGY